MDAHYVSLITVSPMNFCEILSECERNTSAIKHDVI